MSLKPSSTATIVVSQKVLLHNLFFDTVISSRNFHLRLAIVDSVDKQLNISRHTQGSYAVRQTRQTDVRICGLCGTLLFKQV